MRKFLGEPCACNRREEAARRELHGHHNNLREAQVFVSDGYEDEFLLILLSATLLSP